MRCFRWLLLGFFLPWVASDALYNGNPAFPMMPECGFFIGKNSCFSLKAGYEWDDVFNRKLQIKGHPDHVHRKVPTSELLGNFGVVTIGVADRVELYSTLGALSSDFHQRPRPGTTVKFKTNDQWAWSIGGRVILAYWGDIQLGVDAKYFCYSPEVDHLRVNASTVHGSGAGFHYREWQVGAGVSYRSTLFCPYAGVKYSNVRSKFYHLNAIQAIYPHKHFTLENKYPMGLFIGLGLCLKKGFDLNAEARFLDETAVTVSSDFRF